VLQEHSPILKEKGKGSNVLYIGGLTYCRPFSLILNEMGSLSRGRACSDDFFFFFLRLVLAVGLR